MTALSKANPTQIEPFQGSQKLMIEKGRIKMLMLVLEK